MTVTTFTLYDNLSPSSLLESVIVRVFSQDGSSFVTQGETGSDGSLVLDLPDATYWVRFYKSGYSFASKLYCVVDSTAVSNSFDIEGGDLTELPPSGASGICRVSGYVIGAGGAPSAHIPNILFATTSKVRVMGGNIIGTEKVSAKPNDQGYIEVELIQGVQYDCTMTVYRDEVIPVVVPDKQACNITELLYPTGGAITGLADIAGTVDVKVSIDIQCYTSSGVALPMVLEEGEGYTSAGSFFLTNGDDLLVELSGTELSVTGAKAGTYTVTIETMDPSGYRVDFVPVINSIEVVISEP
jgi:hypothetical protein